jgi:hypothetical protein
MDLQMERSISGLNKERGVSPSRQFAADKSCAGVLGSPQDGWLDRPRPDRDLIDQSEIGMSDLGLRSSTPSTRWERRSRNFV